MIYTCQSHHKTPIGQTTICNVAVAETGAGTTLSPAPLQERSVARGWPVLPPMDERQWDWGLSMSAHVDQYRGAGGGVDRDLPVPF